MPGITVQPVDLDAIEASVAASGYGPWTVTRGVLPAVLRTNEMGEASVVAQASSAAVAEFIARARTEVPALVDVLRELRELALADVVSRWGCLSAYGWRDLILRLTDGEA